MLSIKESIHTEILSILGQNTEFRSILRQNTKKLSLLRIRNAGEHRVDCDTGKVDVVARA